MNLAKLQCVPLEQIKRCNKYRNEAGKSLARRHSDWSGKGDAAKCMPKTLEHFPLDLIILIAKKTSLYDLRNSKLTIDDKISSLFKLKSEEIELVSESVLNDLVAKKDDSITVTLAYAYLNDPIASFEIMSFISSVESRDRSYKDLALTLIKSNNYHIDDVLRCIRMIISNVQKDAAIHCITLNLFPKIVMNLDERYLEGVIKLIKIISTEHSQEGLVTSLTLRYSQTLELYNKYAEWLRRIKINFSINCFNQVEKIVNKHKKSKIKR